MKISNSATRRKRKTRSHSFRIDEELLEILVEEANRQGINANSLMNKLLQQYRVHGRHLKRYGAVSMSRIIFSKVINCCTEDELKEIAKTVGSTETKDVLRSHGIPITYDTALQYLKSVGTFSGWFDSIQHVKDTRNYIHLRHELGEKWSTFLAETVSTMFKSIFNKEVKTEKFANCLTIEIPR
jgi:hypothetical protein